MKGLGFKVGGFFLGFRVKGGVLRFPSKGSWGLYMAYVVDVVLM